MAKAPPPLGSVSPYISTAGIVDRTGATFHYNGTPVDLVVKAAAVGAKVGDRITTKVAGWVPDHYVLSAAHVSTERPTGLWPDRDRARDEAAAAPVRAAQARRRRAREATR